VNLLVWTLVVPLITAAMGSAGGPRRLKEATIVGVALMILAVILGRPVANSSFGSWFLLSRQQITIALAVYGFGLGFLARMIRVRV